MIFQESPDGFIIIRGPAGTYIATRAEFLADFGSAPPALPPGIISRIYDTDTDANTLSDGTTQSAGEASFPFGDQAIAALPSLLVAQTNREKPSQPQPQPVTVVVPPPPPGVPAAEFFARFQSRGLTGKVWAAAAADTSGLLGAGLTHGLSTGRIVTTDAEVQGWMAGLVAAGAITQAESDAILAGP